MRRSVKSNLTQMTGRRCITGPQEFVFLDLTDENHSNVMLYCTAAHASARFSQDASNRGDQKSALEILLLCDPSDLIYDSSYCAVYGTMQDAIHTYPTVNLAYF